MMSNKLKLNGDKTELLVLNLRHRLMPALNSIYAGSDHITASTSARNIGVWFDNLVFMDKQIASICKSAFYHLNNIGKIRKFISFTHCETPIHARRSLQSLIIVIPFYLGFPRIRLGDYSLFRTVLRASSWEPTSMIT